MAAWPDIDDAEAYIGEVKADQLPVLTECLAAATYYIDWRCTIEVDEDTEEPIVPDSVREATLMLTSRLFRRRLSPEGVSDFGEFGAVRVTRVDPDIERLITPARSWGFA